MEHRNNQASKRFHKFSTKFRHSHPYFYFWNMEISAKLFKILPSETIETKNGQLKKQLFVVETQDQFPKKICFEIFNDKVNLGQVSEGTQVKVFFEPESREWQGKWFTSLRAWRVDTDSSGASSGGGQSYQQSEPQAASMQAPSSSGASFDETPGNDDLPF